MDRPHEEDYIVRIKLNISIIFLFMLYKRTVSFR